MCWKSVSSYVSSTTVVIVLSSRVTLSFTFLYLSLQTSTYRSGVISSACRSTSLKAATRFLVFHPSSCAISSASLATARMISIFVWVQSYSGP